jgi:PleD family two-component response regulator
LHDAFCFPIWSRAVFDIPIIFITGHGDIPMTVKAMRAGAIEFLTKHLVSRICWMPFTSRWSAIAHVASFRCRRSRCGLDAIRSAIESGMLCAWYALRAGMTTTKSY